MGRPVPAQQLRDGGIGDGSGIYHCGPHATDGLGRCQPSAHPGTSSRSVGLSTASGMRLDIDYRRY